MVKIHRKVRPPPPPPSFNYSAVTVSFFSDIDECSINPGICGSGNTCNNSEGGYFCTCGPGYQSTVDRRSCIGRCYFSTWFSETDKTLEPVQLIFGQFVFFSLPHNLRQNDGKCLISGHISGVTCRVGQKIHWKSPNLLCFQS